MRTYPKPIIRFWKMVDKRGDDECWTWKGALNRYGYGKGIRIDGYQHEAHRASYMLLVGPIPEGLTIDHLCRNRACVNPHHLEAVEFSENSRRANALTHCRRGHERTPSNSYIWTSREGYRQQHCRECKREREAVTRPKSMKGEAA